MKKEKMKFVGSLALVGLIGAGATLAYLTDETGTITNTFTAGSNIDIVITENDIDNGGRMTVDGTGASDGNNYINMLPGEPQTKTPAVDFVNGSNEGYAYLLVTGLDGLHNNNIEITPTNDVDFIVSSKLYGDYKFCDDAKENGWVKIANTNGSTENLEATYDGIYVHKTNGKNTIFDGLDTTDAVKAQTPYFFDSVKIADGVVGVNRETKITDIVLNAAAVQPNADETVANTEAIKLFTNQTGA